MTGGPKGVAVLQLFDQNHCIYDIRKMAPRGKNHELGMMKVEEKTHILAWKEEGISLEEIAKQLGRQRSSIARLVPRAKNFTKLVNVSPQKGLWTSPKDGYDPGEDPEETGAKVSHDHR
jgi:hypothetical protein